MSDESAAQKEARLQSEYVAYYRRQPTAELHRILASLRGRTFSKAQSGQRRALEVIEAELARRS